MSEKFYLLSLEIITCWQVEISELSTAHTGVIWNGAGDRVSSRLVTLGGCAFDRAVFLMQPGTNWSSIHVSCVRSLRIPTASRSNFHPRYLLLLSSFCSQWRRCHVGALSNFLLCVPRIDPHEAQLQLRVSFAFWAHAPFVRHTERWSKSGTTPIGHLWDRIGPDQVRAPSVTWTVPAYVFLWAGQWHAPNLLGYPIRVFWWDVTWLTLSTSGITRAVHLQRFFRMVHSVKKHSNALDTFRHRRNICSLPPVDVLDF